MQATSTASVTATRVNLGPLTTTSTHQAIVHRYDLLLKTLSLWAQPLATAATKFNRQVRHAPPITPAHLPSEI